MEPLNNSEGPLLESQISSRKNSVRKSDLFLDEPSDRRKEIEKLIESRKLMKQSAVESEPRQSILPMHRKLTLWQRFDNWLWIGSQNEFQNQCRNVRFKDGKEHIVILNRVFWIVILTFQLSIDKLTYGNFGDTLKLMQKWGLWFTYMTFLTGLFACSPQPNDATVLLKSYKNSPF